MNTILAYHDYSYYPYERVLAVREATTLLGGEVIEDLPDALEVRGGSLANADRLTYFAEIRRGNRSHETIQARLEKAASGQKRQSTRYSVHGLHEYKGKFNPQIAKALLNICGIGSGSRVLDPFCGSGTTLVEAAHFGAEAHGYDINPFAVFLANAKLLALRAPMGELEAHLNEISACREKAKLTTLDDRLLYLSQWFDSEILVQIESLRASIEKHGGNYATVFFALASNLLRDYSLQDPKDLRIRRRKSPLPATPIGIAFISDCVKFIGRLRASQTILGPLASKSLAVLRDTALAGEKENFDAAITSPPYAMALPYIDTQRLSLVWLGLEHPDKIAPLESTLIGSREMRGARHEADAQLATNPSGLPQSAIDLCRRALTQLSSTDGFRRRAVPSLLYRYFSSMQASFRTVLAEVKPGGYYMLVVGHNHTVLGGKRLDIDTPSHLSSLAESAGWTVKELIPLQTYQRWGYHAANAVAAESLIILHRP